jgi:hypothetical protein
MSSYVYRWGTHNTHVSHFVLAPEEQHAANLAGMRSRLTDPGDGGPLVPSDLSPLWRKFLKGIRGLVTPDKLDEIKVRIAYAAATSDYGAGGGT